jgi:hypothetical protein
VKDVKEDHAIRPSDHKPPETLEGACNRCRGSGKDPKKRSRPCPSCEGRGTHEYCGTCGDFMRCGGRDPQPLDGFMGDAPPCLREGRSDRRTFGEIKTSPCCDRDTDNDGNCPIHEAPGVLRRRYQ